MLSIFVSSVLGTSAVFCCRQSQKFKLLQEVQCRGAKRKGIKMMRLAREKKLGIDPKSRKKAKEKPTLSFAERIAQTKRSSTLSPCLQYPARESDPLVLPESTDNVWSMQYFARKVYSVTEAVDMHRELMHPTMYNLPEAPVRLRLDLNMNLEKKNKFVPDLKQIVDLPRRFIHGNKRTILAFVKDVQLQKEALDLGAEVAGGPDLVKKVHKGQFRTDDFDFIVCHVDMMNDVTPLRGILKRKFPSRLNGGLGSDLCQLIDKFQYGTQYEIKRDPMIPEWGICDTICATLDMSNEEIELNVGGLIRAVCTHRPVTEKLGHFIQRAVLMVVPSKEYFEIDFREFAPPLPQPEDDTQIDKEHSAVVMGNP